MVLAPELVGLMGAMLAVLFLTMVAFAWRATFGALLVSLASLFRAINIHVPWVGSLGLGSVGDAIERVNHSVLHGIGVAIKASEAALAKVWQVTAYTLEEIGATVGDLAEQVEKALHALVAATIPRLIHDARHAVTAPLETAIGRIRHAEQAAEARLGRAINAAKLSAAAALATALVRLHALETHAAALPGLVGREVGDLRGWTAKQLRRALRRVERLEGLLTAVGLTALVATVLGRLGLGWTRCSKVGRVGKAVCALDEGLLEDALTGALAIFGTISLIELAYEMQDITLEVTDAVRWFARV